MITPTGIFTSLNPGYIQVAGIRNLAEADMLAGAGVDLLGFPLGPGVRTPDLRVDEVADITRAIRPPPYAVLITYHRFATPIAADAARTGVHAVQLHGTILPGEIGRLRQLCPDLTLVRSLIVRGDNVAPLLQEVSRTSRYVDAFLTDTHDPVTGADGATGRTHNWAVSREITRVSLRPVILAGGLNPGNVRAAIRAVRPAGVDAHSGLEGKGGEKSPQLVQMFVKEARAAFESGGIALQSE